MYRIGHSSTVMEGFRSLNTNGTFTPLSIGKVGRKGTDGYLSFFYLLKLRTTTGRVTSRRRSTKTTSGPISSNPSTLKKCTSSVFIFLPVTPLPQRRVPHCNSIVLSRYLYPRISTWRLTRWCSPTHQNRNGFCLRTDLRWKLIQLCLCVVR